MRVPNRRFRVECLEDRLTPAAPGDLDPTFGLGGATIFPPDAAGRPFEGDTAAVQPDGKVIVAGAVTGAPVRVFRLRPDGSRDTGFGTNGEAAAPGLREVTSVAVQPDGKLLLAGAVATAAIGQTGEPSADFAVVRLTADGKLDPTFDADGLAVIPFTDGAAGVDVANAVAVLPDGKIVLAGFAHGQPTFAVTQDPSVKDGKFAAARLNADGSLDKTFDGDGRFTTSFPVGGFDRAAARAITVLPDGRVVLAGSVVVGEQEGGSRFPVRFAVRDFAAVRLTADGKLDPAFGDGGKARVPIDQGGANSDEAYAVRVLADGRVVLAGSATTATGGGYAVARLTADGKLDPTFDADGKVGGAVESANAAVVLADGRVVFNGSEILVLTADGKLDPAFGAGGRTPTPFYSVGDGVPFRPQGLAVQPDGAIVVSGRRSLQGVVSRVLTTATTVPVYPVPGSVLAGGTADGKARLLTPTGGPYRLSDTISFFPDSTVTVRTATADVTGDGVPDFIGVAGPGGGAHVKVFDGRTRALVAEWFAFEATFTGGLYVAAADLDGDGKAEVVVTPDRGGGPVVAVYDGAKLAAGVSGDAAQVARFLGIGDPDFRGGARSTLGDVNGDETADLVVSAGFLGGPRVAVFDGTTLFDFLPAVVGAQPPKLVADFFAFEETVRNGAFVSAGDADGDGYADLAFGGGPGGGPRVRVVSGQRLMADPPRTLDDPEAAGLQLANLFAGDSAARGGVAVALRDANGDGKADALLAASGEGEASRVRVYGALFPDSPVQTPTQDLDPFAGATVANGVFVG